MNEQALPDETIEINYTNKPEKRMKYNTGFELGTLSSGGARSNHKAITLDCLLVKKYNIIFPYSLSRRFERQRPAHQAFYLLTSNTSKTLSKTLRKNRTCSQTCSALSCWSSILVKNFLSD